MGAEKEALRKGEATRSTLQERVGAGVGDPRGSRRLDEDSGETGLTVKEKQTQPQGLLSQMNSRVRPKSTGRTVELQTPKQSRDMAEQEKHLDY
jgi:hypothetical protein